MNQIIIKWLQLDIYLEFGDNFFWLASRFIWGGPSSTSYAGIMAWGTHMINDFTQYRGFCQLYYYSPDNPREFRSESGFRPVFKLRSDVKILSGDGTSTNPYVLGI